MEVILGGQEWIVEQIHKVNVKIACFCVICILLWFAYPAGMMDNKCGINQSIKVKIAQGIAWFRASTADEMQIEVLTSLRLAPR
jgi:hypothetical protein